MAIAVPTTRAQVLPSTVAWSRLVRPAIAIGVVAIAYHTSLATLFEWMRLDTPLAHLAMVPFIALGLAFASRHRSAGADIHDRQVDWIIGITLCGAALLANLVLPEHLSTDFWSWRIDLLTMPAFVAGVVCLLFGVRTLWKYRVAVLFLFLAWPYPYTLLLDRWLARFTQVTVWTIERAIDQVHVATVVPGSDAVFQVLHRGTPVQMNVASECSGANGMVGFLLVASAFMLVVRGTRWRKLAWLAVGAALVWTLNVVRILVIFWVAQLWGERVAIDGFHPYIGLVVFNLAVLAMVVLLRPFGLSFAGRRPAPVGATGSPAAAGSFPPPHGRPSPGLRAPTASPRTDRRPRLSAATLVVVLAVTGTIAVLNGNLRAYDLVSDSLGSPRLESFATTRDAPPGWTLQDTGTFDWSKRFFGQSSTWTRYLVSFAGDASSPLQANVPMTVDVIETGDRASLSAYGVKACYEFHGFEVGDEENVDLGNGVRGGALTWTDTKTDLTWTTLYWHWPIKTASGTRYERVTLLMNDQPQNVFVSPGPDGAAGGSIGTSPPVTDTSTRHRQEHEFMRAFARELISLRPASSAG